MMFSRVFSTASKQAAGQLRTYNPFLEFKSDINQTLDRHVQMTNRISDRLGMIDMMQSFYIGGMVFGFSLLYFKSKTDKKELNDKIELINSKLDKVLKVIEANRE